MKLLNSNQTNSITSEVSIFENGIEWLPSTKASTYLGISENALRIMVHRNQVKYKKIRRRLRFHIDDLRALLAQNKGAI